MKKLIKSSLLLFCFITISSIEAMLLKSHIATSREKLPEAQASFFYSSNISNHPPVEAMAVPFHIDNNHVIEAEVVTSTKQQLSHENLPQDAIVLEQKVNPLGRPITKKQQQNVFKFKQQGLEYEDFQARQAIPTAIAQDALLQIPITEEPVIVYDSAGQKLSEHLLQNDNSEHNKYYNADGSTNTIILDKNKIKQQEITEKPDYSFVIKNYDKESKLESTEIILSDKSRIYKINNFNGDRIGSDIYNKSSQLEASSRLNDYGNTTTTHYNLDGSVARTDYHQPVEITILPDGKKQESIRGSDGSRFYKLYQLNGEIVEKTGFVNLNGIDTYTLYQADGRTVARTGIMNPNGSDAYTLYQADGIKITKTGNINPDGSQSYEDYELDGLTMKKSGFIDVDGSEAYIKYQADGLKMAITGSINSDGSNSYMIYQADGKTVKRVGNINPDDSETYIKYQADGISKKETGIIDKDGNGTYTRYSLLDDEIVIKRGIIKNNRLLV